MSRRLAGIAGATAFLLCSGVGLMFARLLLDNRRLESRLMAREHASAIADAFAAEVERVVEGVRTAIGGLPVSSPPPEAVDPMITTLTLFRGDETRVVRGPPPALELLEAARRRSIDAAGLGAGFQIWRQRAQRPEASSGLAILLALPGSDGGSRSAPAWRAVASLDPEALDRQSGLADLLALGYHYELSLRPGPGAREQVLAQSNELPALPEAATFAIGSGRGSLQLAPAAGWPSWRTLATQVALSLLAAVLVGLWAYDQAHRAWGLRQQDRLYRERFAGVRRQLFEEVTQRRSLQDELHRIMREDPATGMMNRHSFIDRLERLFSLDPGQPAAVLVVGLDRFQAIEESVGPVIADQLRCELAHRLGQAAGPGDLVGYLGGDRFGVLLGGTPEAAGLRRVAERLQRALREPLRLDGREVFTSASVGIANNRTGVLRAGDLLRDAESSLHQAVAGGVEEIVEHDGSAGPAGLERIELEGDLRRAIARQQLRAYYQPVVHLGRGEIHGFEALVRWEHPERGLVSPARFIPLAEESNLIVEIDRWMLREACRQTARWLSILPPGQPLYVSVNLSARDLRQTDLPRFVASTLEEAGLGPERLALELTESAVISNPEEVRRHMEELRRLGVRLFMDDFGTGYSSLSYLNRLPFDTLKIDHTFVNRIALPGESSGLVRAMVNMARELGLSTVAEGPEEAGTLEIVEHLGCDYAQGPFCSWPVPAPAAEKLLLGSVGGQLRAAVSS